jgi:hypothetical protein
MRAADYPGVTPSSGNVFADLGLPDAEEMYAKSLLSIVIARAIRERGLTQWRLPNCSALPSRRSRNS